MTLLYYQGLFNNSLDSKGKLLVCGLLLWRYCLLSKGFCCLKVMEDVKHVNKWCRHMQETLLPFKNGPKAAALFQLFRGSKYDDSTRWETLWCTVGQMNIGHCLKWGLFHQKRPVWHCDVSRRRGHLWCAKSELKRSGKTFSFMFKVFKEE